MHQLMQHSYVTISVKTRLVCTSMCIEKKNFFFFKLVKLRVLQKTFYVSFNQAITQQMKC